MALDSTGNLYVADGNVVRRISASTGIIDIVAGNRNITIDSGDGGLATNAGLTATKSLTFDAAGNLYIGDNGSVRKVTASTGIITTVAGNGDQGSNGDDGLAINAEVSPSSLALDTAGNLYIVDDFAVRVVSASTGIISKWAGIGFAGFSGDGGSATAAEMLPDSAGGIAFDAAGNHYIADTYNARIRNVVYPNWVAATPSFSVAPATYTSAQTVTISDATAGATIYYTTDGSVPTANSNIYTDPITVSSTETLQAIATASGYSTSDVATAAYTITLPTATPTFSLEAGPYTSAQTVTISDATAGATIYYTTNGTTPTTSSSVYSGPITVSSSETLEALATANGYSTSTVATAAYTINIPTNPVPVLGSLSPAFTDAGGADFTLTVSGSEFTAGSQIYWGTSALATQYVSATQLTAQVPAASIATAGITAITVETLTPGGGTSNSLQFEVDSAATGTTPPAFTSLTASVTAGSAATYPVTVPSTVTSVTATCLNLPTGASCSYSSTTNAVTITTSSTTPKGTYQVTVVFTQTMPGAASAVILLPILLLPLVFVRWRLAARGVWFAACLGVILMTGAAFATGCGGGGGSSSTPVTSTNPTHQVTSSGAVSLTIQ
jgi:hypothetical protein